MGRKAKTGSGAKVIVITVRLSEVELWTLDTLAKMMNMTRTDVIRTLALEKLRELNPSLFTPEPRK